MQASQMYTLLTPGLVPVVLKVMNRPSEVIAGFPPPAAPEGVIEIIVVVGAQPRGAPVQVSRRKMQPNNWLGLHCGVFGRMFVAAVSKATYLPSALIAA